MDARLESHLLSLARQYAPQLIIDGWAYMDDAKKRHPSLARQLAASGLLVILADTGTSTAHEAQDRVQQWRDGYVNFYRLLTQTLFPSLIDLGEKYADDQVPVILMLRGKSKAVIEVMAGYLSPYIVRGQRHNSLSEPEIMGLMNMMLGELEANDSRELQRLTIEGADIIKHMLMTTTVRQLPLTPFDKAIFTQTGSLAMPKRPDTLPETGGLSNGLKMPALNKPDSNGSSPSVNGHEANGSHSQSAQPLQNGHSEAPLPFTNEPPRRRFGTGRFGTGHLPPVPYVPPPPGEDEDR